MASPLSPYFEENPNFTAKSLFLTSVYHDQVSSGAADNWNGSSTGVRNVLAHHSFNTNLSKAQICCCASLAPFIEYEAVEKKNE